MIAKKTMFKLTILRYSFKIFKTHIARLILKVKY